MGINWKRVAWIAVVFYLIYAWPTEGNGPITITVYPKAVICPLGGKVEVRVTTKITRHADNRLRSLSWASPSGQSGSSTSQMEGEEDAQTFQQFITVSPGSYLFTACVFRVTEGKVVRFCTTDTLEVR